MDLDERLATLTDAEREVLRLYLAHSDVKLIGRAIDRSVHAVDMRLRSARRKLGVTRTLDAALMLARSEEGPAYATVQLRPSGTGGDAPPIPKPPVENGSSSLLPFPTKGRPWNDLPPWARLAWIAIGMLVVTMSSLATVGIAESLSRIARQH